MEQLVRSFSWSFRASTLSGSIFEACMAKNKEVTRIEDVERHLQN